jgi:hypothetical protein
MVEENTTRKKDITALTIETNGGANSNTKERSKTAKKKMKMTQENIPFGHVCDDIAVDDDTPYIRVYCQNVSGIFDRDGIGLDSAFREIKQANADIFMFNSFQAKVPYMGPEKGSFLRGCISLKNRSYCPLLRHSTAWSGWISARCFKYITEAYGRWKIIKIIIFLTHLFNAR